MDGGLDVSAKVFHIFNIGGHEIWLTQTVVTTWVIMAVIIFVAFLARLQLKRFTEKPESTAQNLIEIIIDAMDNFVKGTMGEKYDYFGNWFFGVFVFILVSNLSGLLGFRPPTADLATTACLGFATFLLIHISGIIFQKGGYFKGYFEPIPIMLPMNIISELATPISLSFRLFGNILGGSIIMGMVYCLPKWLNFFIPGVLHRYFDLFAGCIQTVIFVMLSMTFIKDKMGD